MTTKDTFSEDEWTLVAEAPTSAGMIVLTASKGGTFRETFAISKAYSEARTAQGKSELLDALVGSKPKMDHSRHHSADELKAAGLQHVRDAVALLESKATPPEVADYREFVLTVSRKVASAHSEHDQTVSAEEAAALNEIETALGAAPG